MSKTALEASKVAAGVSKNTIEDLTHASKNTIEDLTYVGKNTFGDFTKSAKAVAEKKGFIRHDDMQQHQDPRLGNIQMQESDSRRGSMSTSLVQTGGGNLIASTSRDFFSNIGSDLNGITAATTSMFSDLFGSKNQKSGPQPQQNQAQSPKQKEQKPTSGGMFGPFPRGPRGLVERSSLIKHTGARKQEDVQRIQSAERSTSNTENQVFLKDVSPVFSYSDDV